MTERALVGNASDPEQVRKAEKLEELDRLEFIANLRNALARPEVRRVLWTWIARCGVQEPSFIPGRDAATTAYFEGERNIGNIIMADWQEADLQSFFAAMLDNKRRGEQRTR
jgi:hypothetical protein